MMLDKMGPATNHPKNAILSLAARSVISKRDRDATSIAGNSKEYKKYNQIIEEESKLIDKYYKDYYGGQKNGSTRSRGSSTDSKHDVKGKKQLEMHFVRFLFTCACLLFLLIITSCLRTQLLWRITC